MTNCSLDFNASSILNSTAEPQNFSSGLPKWTAVLHLLVNDGYFVGYFSGYDLSHTPISVKRNLSSSFAAEETRNPPKSLKALFEHNNTQDRSVIAATKDKRKSLNNVAAIVKSSNVRRKIQVWVLCNFALNSISFDFFQVIEPSSPPKVKVNAIGSKESRRNLKRLTR